MNDSDDELLSGVVDGIDEDEDWTDTGWAQPVNPSSCKTKASSGPSKQGAAQQLQRTGDSIGLKNEQEHTEKRTDNSSLQLKVLKESLVDSAKDQALVNRMLLNDNKAGMEGLDKDKINQIIHEASKGSKFYENERKKEEQMKKRIDEQRLKIEKISEEQLQQGLTEADSLLEEFERYRDLSQTIVHIDMDAFYAAVEMRDDPSLKDKPMAVGGTAMLSTSNYHARKFGVRAAMPGFIAKKLCPDLVIVPSNFDKYTAVSKQVRSIMSDYDPNFCPMSLDEAYLNITDHLEKRQCMSELERTFLCRDKDFVYSKDHCLCDLNVGEKRAKLSQQHDQFGEPVSSDTGEVNLGACEDCGKEFPPFHKTMFGVHVEEAVKELRTRIEQRTRLTASAGIAPNMMLAKVCSDKNKPNGQYRVPATREAVINFIKDLSTRKVGSRCDINITEIESLVLLAHLSRSDKVGSRCDINITEIESLVLLAHLSRSDKISGIGKVSETMLNAVGVFTCTDLYEKRALLYHLYSPISFNYFMRICLGIGSTTVERDSERKSMSTERTFSEISKPADLYQKCGELCESLADDLKEEQLKGKTVSIKLKTVKFEVKTRAQSLADYTADRDVILHTATDLLKTEIQACSPLPLRLRLMGVRMSNLLHENFCKSKRQNTITGLLKKMAEKNVPDSGVLKSNFSNERTGTINQFYQQDSAEMVELEKDTASDNSCALLLSETEIANRKTQCNQAENTGNGRHLPVNFVNAKNLASECMDIGSEDSEHGKLMLDKQENHSNEVKPTEKRELNMSLGLKNAEKLSDASQEKDGTQEAILYTPGRRTRSGLKGSPKNVERRKRRNSKQISVASLTAYVCPVCCQNMLFKDLNQFNEHIDDCIVEKDITSDHFPAYINGKQSFKLENTGVNYDANLNIIKENTQSATDRTAEETEKLNQKNGKRSKNAETCTKISDCLSTEKGCIKPETKTKVDDVITTKLTLSNTELQLNDKPFSMVYANSKTNISTMHEDSMLQHKLGDTENIENVGDEHQTDMIEVHEKEVKDAAVTAGNRSKDCDKTDLDESEFYPDECILKRDSFEMDTKEKISEEDQSQAVAISSEIKSSTPNETQWPAGNSFDPEYQCDLVSSTNENDCDKIECEDRRTVQLEPDLPYLDPDLLDINGKESENSGSDMKCQKEVKNDQIYDIVIDSTSSSLCNNSRAIVDDSEMEQLVDSLIDKTIAQNIEESIDFKTGGSKKTCDLDSPRKLEKNESSSSGNCSTRKEKPHCSVDGTEQQVEMCPDICNNTVDKDSVLEEDQSLLVCPICNIEQRVSDLSGFNNHVDSCLSRGTISEILKEQKENDGEKSKSKRSLPPASGQKSVKRRKTNLKMPSCRSIASFFQEK